MQLAWLTDIHLDFLEPAALAAFLDELSMSDADAFAITGDIAQADTVVPRLELLAETVARRVYFVLGNHDFYHGSIRGVRQAVETHCRGHRWLRWMPECGVVPLTARWSLVGHDGWADGRLGNYEGSMVLMNDYLLIDEFRGLDKLARWRRLQAEADAAADHLRAVLDVASGPHCLVLTHVPPFREACWYEGRISNDEWLPHFSSQAVGQALLDAAAAHPERRILVLCGHTHGAGRCWPLPNLEVRTGGAEYGRPAIQGLLSLD